MNLDNQQRAALNRQRSETIEQTRLSYEINKKENPLQMQLADTITLPRLREVIEGYAEEMQKVRESRAATENSKQGKKARYKLNKLQQEMEAMTHAYMKRSLT